MGSRNARGLKTGTMTAVLEPITSQGDSANNTKTTPSEICSVVSYDSEDRIACVETSNILGGKDRTVTDYTFSGKPSSMAITHTASGRSTTEENGCSVTLADNQYDEFGRLQTDRRNGSASLATEYSYNIHGMPTRISTPLYTESLFYEQSHNGSTPQYGGNISAIDWSVADESDTYGQRGYIFSYDGMSRLTAAGYLENGKRNDHFSTSYKYDLMGNILSLRREGLLNSGNYGTIDDLTYSYKGNQVVKIDDAAEESPSYKGAMHFRDYADEETEYTYDSNGNMLTDSNKGITSIDYNVLDLPQCISTKSRALFKESSNDTIYYTYSADGTKLRSTYKKAEFRVYPYDPNVSSTSLNIGTVGMAKTITKRLKTKYYYCSNLVYDNDNISAILFDGGYASVDDDNGIVMHFYVKDHLGSNRLVVDGNGNIEEVNHYYPFGALMGDRCGVSRNKYKYTGKELDTMYGWNMQDHEARWYDPVVGRWMVTDPLQEIYLNVSSYSNVLNNPLRLIDPDGNHVEVTLDKENKYIVTGGALDDDKNIYIIEHGKRTGNILGKSLTKYSFFGSDNKVVVGAQIDISDKSGQIFFDKDIVKSKIDVIYYMANATGGQKYDFKTIGIKNRGNLNWTQYSYRGMPFTDENGNKFIASARDIGNYSAGYMAGISGQGWEASRAAFDALESVQNGRFSTEAMVSQAAEKAGFDRGHKKYWQQQYEVQRMLQEGRVHTWNVIKGWFKSLFGR